MSINQPFMNQNYSINTCLIYLTDYTKFKLSEGNLVGMAVLDVQEASDCVNHIILCPNESSWDELHSTWFRSYSTDRKQIALKLMVSHLLHKPSLMVNHWELNNILDKLLYLCDSNVMTCHFLQSSPKALLYLDD